MKEYKNRTCLAVSLFFTTVTLSAGISDIDTVKERVVGNMLKSPASDSEIESLLETQNTDGTWPGIDYEDVSREGFRHMAHLDNMVTLARAYRSRSSKFHKKRKLREAVAVALKHWVEHDYLSDNWWHNQIGTPNALVTLMLIMGNELPSESVQKAQKMIGRANIDAPGARPGGDRIKIAGIEAKNMLFLDKQERFATLMNVIEKEIKYVTHNGMEYGYGYRDEQGGFQNRSAGGRGIQYDNSFHHRSDGVNNTLSYGLGYAKAFAEWAAYTAGTSYAFAEVPLALLTDYFLDGICKMSVYGKYPDAGAKNRSISRPGSLHAYDSDIPKYLLKASGYRSDELRKILDIRSEKSEPTLSHATFYWNSEHFSFQRPDFFTSVRMYSTRTHNMEYPYNSEGLLNHYRGDGANHIFRSGEEYDNIWPVYDYRKIPGATIVQKDNMPPPEEIRKLGRTDFVGAVTDGKYGAAAFDFKSLHDTVAARKAWFFFDEEYVALGAGISYGNEVPVATTLNQCLLRGEVALSKNNTVREIERGEKEYRDLDWVFQDGIGYVFPNPTSVFVKNNQVTGSWRRVNKQTDSPEEKIEQDVFKLWIDHGESPTDASYEYIVVPATSVEKLEEGHSRKNVDILSNTPDIQAVVHKKLNIYQIIFYKAGAISLSKNLNLVSDSPGIVMLKTDGENIQSISVSDPNRELVKMHLSISDRIEKREDGFSAIWDSSEKVSNLSIAMPQGVYAGKSITIDL
ncbi:MAG TPA: polysaccharide lyase family 8 super-sandwich domain-containing protein [Pricia sp.]|nr:polysaccharide lyase family 8 super-sandwich domain-containing protein [Pricia sp.]